MRSSSTSERGTVGHGGLCARSCLARHTAAQTVANRSAESGIGSPPPRYCGSTESVYSWPGKRSVSAGQARQSLAKVAHIMGTSPSNGAPQPPQKSTSPPKRTEGEPRISEGKDAEPADGDTIAVVERMSARRHAVGRAAVDGERGEERVQALVAGRVVPVLVRREDRARQQRPPTVMRARELGEGGQHGGRVGRIDERARQRLERGAHIAGDSVHAERGFRAAAGGGWRRRRRRRLVRNAELLVLVLDPHLLLSDGARASLLALLLERIVLVRHHRPVCNCLDPHRARVRPTAARERVEKLEGHHVKKAEPRGVHVKHQAWEEQGEGEQAERVEEKDGNHIAQHQGQAEQR
eukprot:scaffold107488_cov30-Tisochrysis_lutea.AAC.4